MDSNVGLAIQCIGILLLTLLSLFIRSSIKSESLKYWTAAWASLSVALLSLFVAFGVGPHSRLFYSLFFVGEYLFGLLFIARCGREVELTNRKLREAHDRLELLVQMDPLTEALNRHAFHSLLRRQGRDEKSKQSGSVAVIDIDNLKPINDTFGHTVGDKAIRAVAKAMRSLVRADDMLFRWGGDEFLVLMFNLPESEAERRMETLNDILEQHFRPWTDVPTTVTVSVGVAGFSSLSQLGSAIESADKAMYAQRHQVRAKVSLPRVKPGTRIEAI
jgi:diguanylate cyclase (GGDEF)-like protein